MRHSKAGRLVRAALFIIGGLFGGIVCIVIPLVHLVTTWGFPLLGIYLGLRETRRETAVYGLDGICPNSNEKIELAGSWLNEPTWQSCPNCHVKLSIRATDFSVQLP